MIRRPRVATSLPLIPESDVAVQIARLLGPSSEDRYGLRYPYVHVRNERSLKTVRHTMADRSGDLSATGDARDTGRGYGTAQAHSPFVRPDKAGPAGVYGLGSGRGRQVAALLGAM